MAQAAELIDWYRCRWEIEILFHVLKNGCRVEALQLGEVKKLELALAIYLVVSWRLAHLVRLDRIHPELPASEVFDQVEWQAAWLLAQKAPQENATFARSHPPYCHAGRIPGSKRRRGAWRQNALAGLHKNKQLRYRH